jgi:hypothetical protein
MKYPSMCMQYRVKAPANTPDSTPHNIKRLFITALNDVFEYMKAFRITMHVKLRPIPNSIG